MIAAEVLRPSRLGAAEETVWEQIVSSTPHLQRAFFLPEFARACDRATGRAYVAVLHEAGAIRAFLPFQFRSAWHARLRLAERIGGDLCDSAGLVADSRFVIPPATLLQCCGLSGLFLTHLPEAQAGFGLVATSSTLGHEIDLSVGSLSYFNMLKLTRKAFVQDTQRRMRRAAREYGELRFSFTRHPLLEQVAQVISAKRDQYRRTSKVDIFDEPTQLQLIEAVTEVRTANCTPVLSVLTAGSRTLAQHFGLLHNGVLNYWFPVYDVDTEKTSPGRLLLWHTLERADSLGIRLVDRGEGDSEAKRDFSTGTVRFGRANFFRRSVWAGAARLWQAAEWRLVRLRETHAKDLHH